MENYKKMFVVLMAIAVVLYVNNIVLTVMGETGADWRILVTEGVVLALLMGLVMLAKRKPEWMSGHNLKINRGKVRLERNNIAENPKVFYLTTGLVGVWLALLYLLHAIEVPEIVETLVVIAVGAIVLLIVIKNRNNKQQ